MRTKILIRAVAIVHDHFDGSMHCKECNGECQLLGADMAYTALVRYLFEAEAYHGQLIAHMATEEMRRTGVPVERFRERAAAKCKPIRR